MGDELKSAFELAMEKLKAEEPDRTEVRLTDDQRRRIAQVRTETKAKLAEMEIMHKSEIQKLIAKGDFESLAAAEAEYQQERSRLREGEHDRVERIRREPEDAPGSA